MASNRRTTFKPSQLYDWDTEPRQERGSSLFEESGYRSAFNASRRVRRAHKATTLGWAVAVVMVFGTAGVVALAHLLRG